jgi:hypothetical protein
VTSASRSAPAAHKRGRRCSFFESGGDGSKAIPCGVADSIKGAGGGVLGLPGPWLGDAGGRCHLDTSHTGLLERPLHPTGDRVPDFQESVG